MVKQKRAPVGEPDCQILIRKLRTETT